MEEFNRGTCPLLHGRTLSGNSSEYKTKLLHGNTLYGHPSEYKTKVLSLTRWDNCVRKFVRIQNRTVNTKQNVNRGRMLYGNP